jgi:hypothetical protein
MYQGKGFLHIKTTIKAIKAAPSHFAGTYGKKDIPENRSLSGLIKEEK